MQAHLSEDVDHYRREALGAFAHELRTPLTSLRMVVDLARQGSGDALVLDAELASMLDQSLDHLQRLADDLHEQSRLERGMVARGTGRCALPAAFEAARRLLPSGLSIDGPPPPAISGPWDEGRLARAIAGFVDGADRAGEGRGIVRLRSAATADAVAIQFESGLLRGEPRPLRADAGFAFFCARQYIVATGGSVECDRRERAMHVAVRLPLARGEED